MEHLYTYVDPPKLKDLDKACRVLNGDGLIAYPTDMNWALGCDATSGKAMDRIHMLKPGHSKDRPFSILCASISMASEIVSIDNSAYRILKKLWPGPYTVILPASRNLPRQLKEKRRVVGVRVPHSPLLLAIVEQYGRPLATSSVPDVTDHIDPTLMRPPRFGYEVAETYGHGLDLILDLGDEVVGLESTVIDLSEGEPVVVRIGAGSVDIFDV